MTCQEYYNPGIVQLLLLKLTSFLKKQFGLGKQGSISRVKLGVIIKYFTNMVIQSTFHQSNITNFLNDFDIIQASCVHNFPLWHFSTFVTKFEKPICGTEWYMKSLYMKVTCHSHPSKAPPARVLLVMPLIRATTIFMDLWNCV